MTPEGPVLIVNADDFGQSSGITRGVLEAHDRGIVTSASLMVRWPATAEAASSARSRSDLSLGLHVDLGEWSYRRETWVPVYEVTAVEDPARVRSEIAKQVGAFRDLTGKDPTHLDSHQHVHRSEPIWSILAELADQMGVPLRHRTAGIRYLGDFYGQSGKGEPYPAAITVAALQGLLRGLGPGIWELGCHPGYGSDLDSMYRHEREQELRVLCDPAVVAVVEAKAIRLRSFAHLGTEIHTSDVHARAPS